MALVVLCTKLKRELNKDLGAACIIRCSDRNIANYPPLTNLLVFGHDWEPNGSLARIFPFKAR